MSDMKINDVLQQIRTLSAKASQSPINETETSSSDFKMSLKNALNSVNDIQMKTGELQKSFEQGDPGISLAQVMVASQKSSIAFQAVVNVRNKVVQAYKDIMNMPV